MLAHREILGLDLLLRALDGARHHAVLDGHAFFHAQALHQTRNAVGAEDAHQVVFERQIETRAARIALAASAAAQLVVDAARFVPFGAEDMQPALRDHLGVLGVALRLEVAEDALPVLARHAVVLAVREVDGLFVVHESLFAALEHLGHGFSETLLARHVVGAAAKQDVGAAARHVGGDGHHAEPSGLGHDLGFLGVVFGVQHHVFDAAPLQHRRDLLRLFDADGSDEHGPAIFLLLGDVGDDGVVLLDRRPVDQVGFLDPAHRLVGRNHHHVELVDLVELRCLGLGRAGHAGQPGVLAEVVLKGDGRQRLVLAFDLHAFLGFDGLMEAVAPAAAWHETARELVDDHDLAVFDHVLDVEPVVRMGAQALLYVMQERHVDRVVETARLQPVRQELLGLRNAGLGERHGLALLIDRVVAGRLHPLAIFGLHLALVHQAARERGNDAVDLVVEVVRFFGRARDDERRARFVDENAVDFVDDREVVPALHHARQVELHVVTQVVEAELVVGAVGDVAGVRGLALLVVEVVLDHADGEPDEAVDAAHPLRIAAGQVVVDRDDVDALAAERVEIGGQRGHEGLTLAGLHLANLALVQHHAADQLHVVVPHVQHPLAGLAHEGKRLRQQIVERLALLGAGAIGGRGGAQAVVRQRAHGGFEFTDAHHKRQEPLEVAVVLGAEDLGEEVTDHAGLIRTWRFGECYRRRRWPSRNGAGRA